MSERIEKDELAARMHADAATAADDANDAPEPLATIRADTDHVAGAVDQRQGTFVEGDQYNLSGDFRGDVFIGSTVVEAEAAYDVHGLPNPYLGLRAFTYAERARYAGRESEIAAAVEELTAPGAQRTLLFVTGASGSGKSSFGQAGLVPALEAFYTARRLEVRRAVMRPGERPLAALADALLQLGLPADEAFAAAKPFMVGVPAAAPPEDTVCLLVIDQFEELFTQSEAAQRATLIGLLSALPPFASLRTHIIATLRADYLPELFQRQALYEIAKQGIDLRAMNVEQLVEAIQCPLQQYPEKRIHPDLLSRLAEDAANDAAYLPLLQVTLAEKWRYGRLTLGDYRSLSDALRRRADAVLTTRDYDGAGRDPRPPEEQSAILSLFLTLVDVSLNDDPRLDVRRRLSLDELSRGEPQRRALIADLCAARLLSASAEVAAGEVSAKDVDIDIIHESLISNWDGLRAAIRERRSELRQGARFRQALREWLANDRRDDYLLEGVRLAEAEALAARDDVDLRSDAARELLRRSIAAREAERQRELEHARALAEARAREVRRTRRFAVGLAVVALLALAAAGFAVNRQQLAESQRRLAIAGELAAVAVKQLNNDPELGLVLATESISQTDTPEGEDALRQALAFPVVLMTLRGHSGAVNSVAFSPDGRQLLTASDDGTARIWDAATGQELRQLQGHTAEVSHAAFSRDGRWIVTASKDRSARIWDAATGQELRLLKGHTDAVNAAAFSPDGRLVATGSADGSARIWDAATGQELRSLEGQSGDLRSVAFSPDGSRIATASEQGIVSVSDPATGQLIRDLPGTRAAFGPDDQQLVTGNQPDSFYAAATWVITSDGAPQKYEGHTWYLSSVAFSPDPAGRYILTASRDHTARIWDRAGATLAELRGHQDIVADATFSPDGSRAATASYDRTVRIWDIASWQKNALSGYRATYSPDGAQIATIGWYDGIIHLWDSRTGRPIGVAQGHQSTAISPPFYRPDGREFVTASDDGTARVWDAANGKQLYPLTRPEPVDDVRVHDAAFSPDGQRIVTADHVGVARIWDATTHQQVLVLGHLPGAWMATARFSPDGRLVVTASVDHTARIWDATSGKQLHVLAGHTDLVTSATFSPDGKQIVTSSVDGTAGIWDVATGVELRRLVGHSAEVTFAAFSPDSLTIATASRDHTARVWSAATGRELLRLYGHTSDVFSVAYSPDGTRVIAGGWDGVVRVHLVRFEDVLAQARASIHRTLSCTERAQFLHDPRCPNL